ncbi:hypothetical protein SPRG_15509 [Saprolegnia parasitica CBS 223.65]|uniref:RING-type domain-containing protein n=1 Tax=Saprolegnia parasitica (strain CBS 223.65) TaxID=695850 RepID=A0A067BNE9_SAPPC|nr:hypothetical protein SPRG_15509 [Saprolegnia parasitica CBS 223.65]KDO18265.1 hypothetical protein SPRG_15509 [Saprolegnia parasitica CBS 223.65]|eukprot:XP_012211031.1 hypothetical protein SPRG_15509 [Saprolegnia parasitica CBS 223.65]
MAASAHLLPQTTLDRTRFDEAVRALKVFPSAMNVVSPASGPFVIYTFIVSCPTTQTWWVVTKRYSEFLAFRRTLAALAKRACDDVRIVLRAVHTPTFPKKHPLTPIHNAGKILERLTLFKQYTAMLVSLREACVLRALQLAPSAAKDSLLELYDLVQDFLSIPDALRRDELRRTIALVSPESSSVTEEDTECGCEEACAICLCDYEHGETKLQMPCKHVFHQECVVRWLEKSATCPLCRQDATQGYLF